MSFSLFVSPLGVSQFALGQGNTPQQCSQAVLECCRSCLLEDRFSFCCLLQFGECLPTQFREAGNARLTREADGGCEQLIGDVQGKKRIVAGKCEFCTRVPDEPLPDRVGGIIRPERGVEESFGPRDIVLGKGDERKEAGDNAGPYPWADLLADCERLL